MNKKLYKSYPIRSLMEDRPTFSKRTSGLWVQVQGLSGSGRGGISITKITKKKNILVLGTWSAASEEEARKVLTHIAMWAEAYEGGLWNVRDLRRVASECRVY